MIASPLIGVQLMTLAATGRYLGRFNTLRRRGCNSERKKFARFVPVLRLR